MREKAARHKILVIHGPNLNMLGKREPDIYGRQTLDEINAGLTARANKLELELETFQSNYEGHIVEKIQQAHDTFDGILINPAAYTHTSVAIRDALAMLDLPVVEIHLSNIKKREPFRHMSLISDIVQAQIAGFGPHGYILALNGLAQILSNVNPVLITHAEYFPKKRLTVAQKTG